jgi:hypothetical protein
MSHIKQLVYVNVTQRMMDALKAPETTTLCVPKVDGSLPPDGNGGYTHSFSDFVVGTISSAAEIVVTLRQQSAHAVDWSVKIPVEKTPGPLRAENYDAFDVTKNLPDKFQNPADMLITDQSGEPETYAVKVKLPSIGGNCYDVVCRQQGTEAKDPLSTWSLITMRLVGYTLLYQDDALRDQFARAMNAKIYPEMIRLGVDMRLSQDLAIGERAIILANKKDSRFAVSADKSAPESALEKELYCCRIEPVTYATLRRQPTMTDKAVNELILILVKKMFQGVYDDWRVRIVGSVITLQETQRTKGKRTYDPNGDFKPAVQPKVNLVKHEGKHVFTVELNEHRAKKIMYLDAGFNDINIANLTIDGASAPADKRTLERLSDWQMKITIEDPELNAKLAGQAEVMIDFTANYLMDVGGLSPDAVSAVVTADSFAGSANADASFAILLMHELGHAMGMVDNKISWFERGQLKTAANNLFYNQMSEGGGGAGAHCAFNAKPAFEAEAADAVDVRWEQGKKFIYVPDGDHSQCVMYHSRSKFHDRARWCPRCQIIVRSMDLKMVATNRWRQALYSWPKEFG